MKISYDGDQATALRFTQMAQQEWGVLRPVGRRGRLSRIFRQPWGEATAYFTYGDGMDGIHISARAIPGAGQMFSFLSGAVISAGQLTSTGLLAYAPTVNSIERFAYPTHPLVSGRLTVRPHASMPTRILGGLTDSQYTVQAPSKYTGKMCQLVQLILGYGKLHEDTVIATAVRKFRDSLGRPLVLPPSVIWTKVNIAKGVQNTFGWEWARTHGVFTRTYVVEGISYKQYWLIEISTAGVKAMPLQIEPVTALPEFRAYVVDEIAKPGHKKYFDDVKLVLDTFGGFPSNEAFLSIEPAIVAQRVTILGPEAMPQYVNGTAVSYDHGWAFNDAGNFANTICLETFGDNSWHMAHHCLLAFSWDNINARPKALFSVVESGAAPIGKHYLKVGLTALDACVSYNLGLRDAGDYAGRPRATRTAMLVFWKRDRLEALRWTDGHMEADTNKTESSVTPEHTLTEHWYGASGIASGWFCTLHDGRIPTETYHSKYERTAHVENERQRVIGYSPASDVAEWYSRSFWAWDERRTEIWTGGTTNDSCAFVPLGDRSAFYLVTMTTKARYEDERQVSIYQRGDPYVYSMSDTYIWNWDFGNRVGHKFPVTWGGLTVDGIVDVVWDRSGSRGKAQLDLYGVPYIWGPDKYKGGYGYHNLTPYDEEVLATWTEFTGHAEWADIASEPGGNSDIAPFGGSPGVGYTHVTGGSTTLSVYLVSMQVVGEVFRVTGSYAAIYEDYNYWFDRSPNPDGDYQTMWAFKNYFGGKFYQLYSTDVNNRDLTVTDGYALDPSDFPTFIGVVGEIPA